MKTHIALLRGVNVSGQKLIRMQLLKEALLEMGFEDVFTYIQSGNVLFTSDKSAVELTQSIGRMILEKFGHDVTVIMVTPKELENVLAASPYKTPDDAVQPYIGFLSEVPEEENVAELSALDFGADEWTLKGKTLYFLYADSPASTKLSNALVERKLKVRATTRNKKTVRKLLELVAGIS